MGELPIVEGQIHAQPRPHGPAHGPLRESQREGQHPRERRRKGRGPDPSTSRPVRAAPRWAPSPPPARPPERWWPGGETRRPWSTTSSRLSPGTPPIVSRRPPDAASSPTLACGEQDDNGRARDPSTRVRRERRIMGARTIPGPEPREIQPRDGDPPHPPTGPLHYNRCNWREASPPPARGQIHDRPQGVPRCRHPAGPRGNGRYGDPVPGLGRPVPPGSPHRAAPTTSPATRTCGPASPGRSRWTGAWST